MNIFETLEFTRKWIDLGILTSQKLTELEIEWNNGDDKNPEHYRWRTFIDFMKSKKTFAAEELRNFYKLGECDVDSMMGGAIMVEILQRKDCPLDLLEEAAKSEENRLRKVACRKLGKEFIPNKI